MNQHSDAPDNVVQLDDPRHPQDAVDAAYEQVRAFLIPALDAVVAAASPIIMASTRTAHGEHLVRELIKDAFDRAGHTLVYPTARPMPRKMLADIEGEDDQ